MRRKNGTAKATIASKLDAATAWVKLAEVLAACGQLVDAIDRFEDDADAQAMAGDTDVSRLLHEVRTFIPDQVSLITLVASRAVAG